MKNISSLLLFFDKAISQKLRILLKTYIYISYPLNKNIIY